MKLYKAKEIQELTGASKIQLAHWVNIGAIEPYEEDRRRGGAHKFSHVNLVETFICKAMTDLKIQTVIIQSALAMLRSGKFHYENEEFQGYWELCKNHRKAKIAYLAIAPSGQWRRNTLSFKDEKDLKRWLKDLDEIKTLSLNSPSVATRKSDVGPSFVFEEHNVAQVLKYLEGAILINLNGMIKRAGGEPL